jgi:hypothetical protein
MDGRFDWAVPDDEVHTFVNDLEREVGIYFYGRRMYDVMVGWETAPAGARVELELVDVHQFGRGTLHLTTRSPSAPS